MKKIMSLLLVLVMVLSMAACTTEPTPTEKPTEAPTTEPTEAPTTEPTEAPTTEPTEEPTTEPTEPTEVKAIKSFTMSTSVDFAPTKSMFISDNGDGTVYVEYMGEFRKKSFDFTADALTVIANALAAQDLTALGEGTYEDGNMSCTLTVFYADGEMFFYDYAGAEIPAVFTTIMNAMDAAFQTALADLEVYVPQLPIMGELDAAIQPEMLNIMNNAGIPNLESLGAMEIPMEDAETFGYSAGLSSSEGITAGAVCQNMMMGGAAFQLVIVALEDEAKAATVAADFEANADFGKWLCVRPDKAMTAQKGNLVLCLMAPEAMFTTTEASIVAAGWTVLNTLTDPMA